MVVLLSTCVLLGALSALLAAFEFSRGCFREGFCCLVWAFILSLVVIVSAS